MIHQSILRHFVSISLFSLLGPCGHAGVVFCDVHPTLPRQATLHPIPLRTPRPLRQVSACFGVAPFLANSSVVHGRNYTGDAMMSWPSMTPATTKALVN